MSRWTWSEVALSRRRLASEGHTSVETQACLVAHGHRVVSCSCFPLELVTFEHGALGSRHLVRQVDATGGGPSGPLGNSRFAKPAHGSLRVCCFVARTSGRASRCPDSVVEPHGCSVAGLLRRVGRECGPVTPVLIWPRIIIGRHFSSLGIFSRWDSFRGSRIGGNQPWRQRRGRAPTEISEVGPRLWCDGGGRARRSKNRAPEGNQRDVAASNR